MSNSEATKLNLIAPSRNPLQKLREAGLVVTAFGGFDPVQCEATLPDGRKLYFRAIGKYWDLVMGLLLTNLRLGLARLLVSRQSTGTNILKAGICH